MHVIVCIECKVKFLFFLLNILIADAKRMKDDVKQTKGILLISYEIRTQLHVMLKLTLQYLIHMYKKK